MAQHRQSSHHSNNSNGTSPSDHVSIGIRSTTGRSDNSGRRLSVASVSVFLLLVLLLTLLAYFYISGYNTDDAVVHTDKEDTISYHAVDGELMNEIDFLTNVTRRDTFKVLGFGKGSVMQGRDSRYWDKDDRRRDDDYNEDEVESSSMAAKGGSDNMGQVNGEWQQEDFS